MIRTLGRPGRVRTAGTRNSQHECLLQERRNLADAHVRYVSICELVIMEVWKGTGRRGGSRISTKTARVKG